MDVQATGEKFPAISHFQKISSNDQYQIFFFFFVFLSQANYFSISHHISMYLANEKSQKKKKEEIVSGQEQELRQTLLIELCGGVYNSGPVNHPFLS